MRKGFLTNLIWKGILKSIHTILRDSLRDYFNETLICKLLTLLKEMLHHGSNVVDKVRKLGIDSIFIDTFLMNVNKLGNLAANSLTIKLISNLGTSKDKNTQRNVALSIGEQGIGSYLTCVPTIASKMLMV